MALNVTDAPDAPTTADGNLYRMSGVAAWEALAPPACTSSPPLPAQKVHHWAPRKVSFGPLSRPTPLLPPAHARDVGARLRQSGAVTCPAGSSLDHTRGGGGIVATQLPGADATTSTASPPLQPLAGLLLQCVQRPDSPSGGTLQQPIGCPRSATCSWPGTVPQPRDVVCSPFVCVCSAVRVYKENTTPCLKSVQSLQYAKHILILSNFHPTFTMAVSMIAAPKTIALPVRARAVRSRAAAAPARAA